MWSRHSAKRYLPSVLAALLVLTLPGTALAQRNLTSPMEAVQLDAWFEIPANSRDEIPDALAALMRSGVVRGEVEDGFLTPLPYDPDQFTEAAANFGPPSTLKVWVDLYCTERSDIESPAKIGGVLRFQVWVEDSSSGRMVRLAKLRARAQQGDVYGETGFKLTKLNKGDTLWFQLLRDRVSPIDDVYCYFGYGMYREFNS